MLLPFVELEFTHGLGPPMGRYLVRAPGSRPAPAVSTLGVTPTLPVGSADVLVVRVEQASGVRRPVLRKGRPKRAQPDAPADEVPVYLVSLLLATRAFDDAAAATAALESWRSDDRKARSFVDEAFAVLNRAVRAYRAAAADPYIVEVTRADARAVRIGFGGAGLVRGEWDDAVALPAPQGARLGRAARLRPTELVADVLAGRTAILDGEDVLLRAVLDLEQGRADVAVSQLELAIDLLMGAQDGPGPRLAALAGRPEGVRLLLDDPASRERGLAELSELATTVGEAIDTWRSQ